MVQSTPEGPFALASEKSREQLSTAKNVDLQGKDNGTATEAQKQTSLANMAQRPA